MKLNNRLITSLEAFRQNFDFCQAWNKIDVVVRDLSPSKVTYGEYDTAARGLYKALADPSTAQYIDGALQAADGTLLTRLTAVEATAAESLGAEQQVRVIALCRLGGVPLTKELISHANNEVSFDGNELVLRPWQVVKKENMPSKCKLEYKLMRLPETVLGKAYVGDIVLNPGDVTYGVFAGAHLVAVSPTKVKNDKYYLYYEEVASGVVLKVKEMGREVCQYKNAHFFALVGNDNFVVINGTGVEFYTNSHLSAALGRKISILNEPQIVEVVDSNLIVTLEDASQIRIKL